jgi:hypothetical protein
MAVLSAFIAPKEQLERALSVFVFEQADRSVRGYQDRIAQHYR